MTTGPIGVSDSQYAMIRAAVSALLPVDRDPFMLALVQALRSEPQPLGDGSVGRAIRSLQREFFRAPALGEEPRSRRTVGPAIP